MTLAQICTPHPDRLVALASIGTVALGTACLLAAWFGLRGLAWWVWAMRTIWARRGGDR